MIPEDILGSSLFVGAAPVHSSIPGPGSCSIVDRTQQSVHGTPPPALVFRRLEFRFWQLWCIVRRGRPWGLSALLMVFRRSCTFGAVNWWNISVRLF